MARSSKTSGYNANGSFEAKLWAAANALRNNMDAAEYKHVVLGLTFLKYISDAFEAKHAELDAQRSLAITSRTLVPGVQMTWTRVCSFNCLGRVTSAGSRRRRAHVR